MSWPARLLLQLLIWACAAATPSFAHEAFDITSNARFFKDRVELTLQIADSTAARLCLPDAGIATRLRPDNYAASKTAIEHCAATLYTLYEGKRQLAVQRTSTYLGDENDLFVTLVYPAPSSGNVRFEASHLGRLEDSTYGATLTVTSEDRFLGQKLLRADDDSFSVSLGAQGGASESSFSAFFVLGVEHILGGYDHLLFLAGLLIVCHSLRSTLLIITAFTLAHSITLGLAGLELVKIPSAFVEPAIAATIVYVGIENLIYARRAQEPSRRWLLTFVFGLLHGFGFASALREAGLPQDAWAILKPLLAFNLGVESGQLAVAAVFLPLLFALRRLTWFARYGVSIVSLMVCAAGGWWFVTRTIL